MSRVLIATPKSDCHAVALKLLEIFLAGRGHDVKNIGPCSSSYEIALEAAGFEPEAIFISAQNGHALQDLTDLRDYLRVFGAQGVPVFIGGNLTVGAEKDHSEVRAEFKAIGITVIQEFEQAAEVLCGLDAAQMAAMGGPRERSAALTGVAA